MTPTAGNVIDAVLPVLGYGVTCLTAARKHGKVIHELLEAEIAPAHREALGQRLDALKSKWGDLQQPPGTPLKINAMSPAVWLATRHARERTFYTLKAASELLLKGETRLVRIMVKSFSMSGQTLIAPVSIDTFRLWLLRTGVATHVARGQYAAGPSAERLSRMHWPDMLKEIEGG